MDIKINKLIFIRIFLVLILGVGVNDITPARATGTTYFVKWNATGANNGTSWMDAYTDLQAAISISSSGDEIWVAAGTYKPTSGTNRNISFTLKNGVAIYGGFTGTETVLTQRNYATNIAILSGDIGSTGVNTDNSYHVVIGSNTTSATILDGFTITKGNADASAPIQNGGGIYSHLGDLTLSNLIIKDNAALFGGGMFSEGVTYLSIAYPTLTNVTFINNTAIGDGGGMEDRDFSNSTLINVVFVGNTSNRAGGGMIDINYCNSVLINVTFSGNAAALAGGGFVAYRSSNSTLTNVTFSNNSSAQVGGGMDNEINSNSTLTNVTFNNNSAATSGGAISNQSNSSLTLTNVTINGNSAVTYGDGIYNNSATLVIRNSILYGNGEEIYGPATVTSSIVEGGYAGEGNLDADPLLNPLHDNGGLTQTMALNSGSPAIDAADDSVCSDTDQRGVHRPVGSHCDIGAFEFNPRTIRVKYNATGLNNGTSWVDAYTDLQSALSNALSGDEIWVAAGTYKPTTGTDRTVSFALQNGVAVYGGFSGTETSREQRDFVANISILSGDIGVTADNSDNSYHVVTGGDATSYPVSDDDITIINSSTVLDGFTITGGNANGELSYEYGGGMKNVHSSPTIANVIFTNNVAKADGGGMHNSQSSPSLTRVIFSSNTAFNGGGMYNIIYTGNSSMLRDVYFRNNTADVGGGMYNMGGKPTLTNVTFSGNGAPSGNGGGMYNMFLSSPSLVNVTFNGNIAARGGGIYNTASSPILTNITFSGNYASQSGGGIYNYGGSRPTLTNVILWANGSEIYNDNSTSTISYSIVQGGYAGIGNLNVDPLLGPLQDNDGFTQTMALLTNSPAIDAGDNLTCATTDQRGVTRPQGSHCDIGAYEADGTIIPTATLPPSNTPSPTPTNTPVPTVTPRHPILKSGALTPVSLISQLGTTVGSLSSLSLFDQSGTEDDLDAFVSFQTTNTLYIGYQSFTLPSDAQTNLVSTMLLQVNFKGPISSTQVWTWSIYDWGTGLWIKIGDSLGTTPDEWQTLVFRIRQPWRYASLGKEVRIQLRSNLANGDVRIDYEALHVTYLSIPATPTPVTPVATSVRPGVFSVPSTPGP